MTIAKATAALLAAVFALFGAGFGLGRESAPIPPKQSLVEYNAVANVAAHAAIAAATMGQFKEPQINAVVKTKDGSYVVYFTARMGGRTADLWKSMVTPSRIAEPPVCLSCGEASPSSYQP